MFSYLVDRTCHYPAPPFSPDRHYPELSGIAADLDPENRVYPAVRELFRAMGWDAANYGGPEWNPLGALVGDARSIVIKPNLVLHLVGELECSIDGLVVHASVLRPLVDYLLLAARRQGRTVQITIADTPLQSADFAALCRANGVQALVDFYREAGVALQLHDLRFEHAVVNDHFMIQERVQLPGDPAGARVVDLGERSLHYSAQEQRADFSIQDYDDENTKGNHFGKVHRYKFSQTVLNADLVFNVAKMKCHSKSGVTLALKNIVGANVSKDYLPHFRSGAPATGGDECPHLSLYVRSVRALRNWFNRSRLPGLSLLHAMLKKGAYLVESQRRRLGQEIGFGGAWYGNDTLWRTIVDINRILFFADREGVLQEKAQRKVVFLLDGIYGMQGDGPLKGSDIHAGVLACGDDPVEFDATVTYLMGFDPAKVPHIEYWRRIADLKIGSLPGSYQGIDRSAVPPFREPSGWRGKLL